jgi:CelD/BcsL family acetyltransferase involved in cellulose biosynthesis
MAPANEAIIAAGRCVGADLQVGPSKPHARVTIPSTRLECVDDQWGFTALRPEWNELLRSSEANCPFLTWEWLHTWWKHLAGSSALRLLAVRDNHELIALAPLRQVDGSVRWFSRLEFLGTGQAGSDYLDIIVRSGREADAVRALSRFARSRKLTLRFDRLPSVSAAAKLAGRLSDEGWSSTTAPNGTCPVIRLAGHTWDSYLATLGAAHRANVRRRMKGLSQRFELWFEQITTEADRRAALAALVEFHDRRYISRGGSTAFASPELRAFHDEATRRAMDRGWLRLYSLKLNGALAAVMYGFAYNGRFYFYQHGFDHQYQQHSVGLVLMALTIRAAIDEGLHEFDMLWGVEPYKWLWAHETRLLQQIHLFPAHVGGRVHQRALETRRRLRMLARQVLTPLNRAPRAETPGERCDK